MSNSNEATGPKRPVRVAKSSTPPEQKSSYEKARWFGKDIYVHLAMLSGELKKKYPDGPPAPREIVEITSAHTPAENYLIMTQGLRLLLNALVPFVALAMYEKFKTEDGWGVEWSIKLESPKVVVGYGRPPEVPYQASRMEKTIKLIDIRHALELISKYWTDVFREKFEGVTYSDVGGLLDAAHNWAHRGIVDFAPDELLTALGHMERLAANANPQLVDRI